MQILTNDEAAAWCTGRGFKLDASPYWRDKRISSGIRFLTETKQSVVEAFVRNVVNTVEYDGAIVWFTDWPLYKEDEMAVLERFRSSIGENRRLIDAPGHVFDLNEIHDCIGMFNLSVQYFWDAFLFVPQGNFIAYNSHDGLQYISSLTDTGQTELIAMLEHFDLISPSN